MPPRKGGRGGLADQIDAYAEGDPNELSALVEDLQRDLSDSTTLAQKVTTAQTTQDPKLIEYTTFCRKILNVLPKDEEEYRSLSQQKKDLGLFPRDHEELYKQIGIFLIFVVRESQTTSKARAEYRDVLMSSAIAAHEEHKLDEIPQGRFLRKLTDSMEFALAQDASLEPKTGGP